MEKQDVDSHQSLSSGLSPCCSDKALSVWDTTEHTVSRDEINVLSLQRWMQGCSRRTQTRQCLLCHGQAQIPLRLLSCLGCPPLFFLLQFLPQGRHLLPGSGPAVPLDNNPKLLQVPRGCKHF